MVERCVVHGGEVSRLDGWAMAPREQERQHHHGSEPHQNGFLVATHAWNLSMGSPIMPAQPSKPV